MAKIISVCISEKKGTKKQDIKKGCLEKDHGLVGDAHAQTGYHRQLSLLAVESIEKMKKLGIDVGPGDFAENLTTKGLTLYTLPIGTRLLVGDNIILEVTQIGKECHHGCAIFQQVGKCVMPKEGIFVRIIEGGEVKAGDEIKVIK
jgi:MOSC domain-containing protein YiiM